ncbi:MAG: hypothetical protein E2O62_02185 [Gammaproteobacteria bacterium]|nr:MAG: hypothetical protein E2O62_02185 [Gammaproteobacteria bacterium]
MIGAAMKPVIFPGNRALVWLAFLLASTIILAESGTWHELPPIYDEIIVEEIYQSAGGWRESSPIEYDWRVPPKKKKEGRIKFGYDTDSAYEQMGERQDDYFPTNQTELSDPKPTNNLFRLNF